MFVFCQRFFGTFLVNLWFTISDSTHWFFNIFSISGMMGNKTDIKKGYLTFFHMRYPFCVNCSCFVRGVLKVCRVAKAPISPPLPPVPLPLIRGRYPLCRVSGGFLLLVFNIPVRQMICFSRCRAAADREPAFSGGLHRHGQDPLPR